VNYILAAEHIQKEYSGKAILRNASIHVEQGEIYGLIGKNGSGKTTLFRILTGLIHDYSGTVVVRNVDNRKSRIAAIINDPSLFLNLSAFDNMKAQAYLLGIHEDKKIELAISDAGLNDCKKKLVKNFSLGMTQRLKLAMALLESPEILILDEPANGLDPDGIVALRTLLIRLKRNGMTILVSSHVLSELEQIATCFGILHNGVITEEFHAKDTLKNGNTLEKLYMQYTKGGNSDV